MVQQLFSLGDLSCFRYGGGVVFYQIPLALTWVFGLKRRNFETFSTVQLQTLEKSLYSASWNKSH
jgi:hypothetical protein